MSTLLLICLITFPCLILSEDRKIVDEIEAKKFLSVVDEKLSEKSAELVFAQWCFRTDINDENEKKLVSIQNLLLYKISFYSSNQREVNGPLLNFRSRKPQYIINSEKDLWKNVTRYDYSNFTDYSTRRQFEKLSILGYSALDDEDSDRFTNITTAMEKIYSSATACVKGKCGLELEPDLEEIMSKSRNYEELKETWIKWRDSAGKPVRELYKEYVKLGNKAAVLNGLKTQEDLWLFPWETKDFKEQMETLWQEVEGIYKKLHTYVRMKLRQYYGNKMPNDGTIPAHLLGNMWAQQWSNILDLVAPFPDKSSVDITQTLIKENYTALKMFGIADGFIRNLGLIPMPLEFWEHSMIVKPTNKKVVCMASAEDFLNGKDFRIKMCTNINMEDLVVIHHEMGHIEYFLQYKNQPVVFREGANPGFHEAIGDLLALSVSTPEHLNKIGLLSPLVDDLETTLNYQMKIALEKIAFLPFSYLMDMWRWDVFSNKTTSDQMSKRWWELRIKYQGISPPATRSEKDFDPGAKYHIPAGVEYIRYFVSHIIQFQFHKALCDIAQPNIPLHKCDIDGNKAAGKKFADMLKLGSSEPWPQQLKALTGSEFISAKPLIEYFDPLIKYLDEQIRNEKIGWDSDVERYMELPSESKFNRNLD